MKVTDFTIGSDTEFFVQRQRRLYSAFGVVEGNKWDPAPLPGLNGAFVQHDNVLVEVNTPAAHDRDSWVQSCVDTYACLRHYLKGKNLSIRQGTFYRMPQHFLEYPETMFGGCEPDYNAYTLQANPTPELDRTPYRGAGGHVHIAHPSLEDTDKLRNFLAGLDLTLGVLSSVVDPKGLDRRKWYGRAGAHRTRKYGGVFGVEYRSLPNFWFTNKHDTGLVYDAVETALRMEGAMNLSLEHQVPDMVNRGCDKEAAIGMWQRYTYNGEVFNSLIERVANV